MVARKADINLTFKRHGESSVRLVVENNFVTRVEGDGLDAELPCSSYPRTYVHQAVASRGVRNNSIH